MVPVARHTAGFFKCGGNLGLGWGLTPEDVIATAVLEIGALQTHDGCNWKRNVRYVGVALGRENGYVESWKIKCLSISTEFIK